MNLSINNITKKFGDEPVIDSLSFDVKNQEFVTILGPSGCGKSTILNIVSGLLKPDSGKVFYDNTEITGQIGFVSYMFQNHLLLPWKNTIDNIMLPITISGDERSMNKEDISKLMDEFGLSGADLKYPNELSGGMRQRAALLRTYLMNKEIILLDEPFGALDAITRRKLGFWLLTIAEKLKLTVLFITHDIDEAIILSDRILVISNKPTKLIKEFAINLDKSKSDEFLTSPAFNQLKKEILKIL